MVIVVPTAVLCALHHVHCLPALLRLRCLTHLACIGLHAHLQTFPTALSRSDTAVPSLLAHSVQYHYNILQQLPDS